MILFNHRFNEYLYKCLFTSFEREVEEKIFCRQSKITASCLILSVKLMEVCMAESGLLRYNVVTVGFNAIKGYRAAIRFQAIISSP